MTSTFKSNDVPISEILKDIDIGVNQLPDFQRGWVWDDNRIAALIASISNSYPVGALMFLDYGGDNVRFKYRPFTGSMADCVPETLVLDGQQRLTSIYSAMFCKKPVETKTDKNKEIKRFYYLDIVKCLNSTTDRVDAVLSLPEDKTLREDFGRKIILDVTTTEKEFESHLFPLNIVYDPIATATWLDDYREYHNYDKDLLQRLRTFNAEVLTPIQSYNVPVITLDKNTPKEAVCQVFENVNQGGVSLTVFELITASFAADNFELRKDWDKRYEQMEKKSAALLSDVSSTDFLTALTLVSRYYIRKDGGEFVSCKKKDVLRLSLSEYQKYADSLTEGFIEAANFLREQRIFSSKDLPYNTQLIPLSAMFAILGSKINDGIVRERISRWFWCGVFGEMYGGANETRYANDVTGVLEWLEGGSEPDTIARAYFQPTRLLTLQTRLSAAYKGVMALLLKAGAQDFISGKAMDFTTFLDEQVDIHHIFPRAYCEDSRLDKEKWNSIVNKTPLTSRSNRMIGGNAPSKYMSQIEKSNHVTQSQLDSFATTHLIDVADLRADNFDLYFIKRAKSLLALISAAMGKPISNLGGEDVIKAFGTSLE